MTTRSFLRQYWRIPVVAVLGGLLAFSLSFLLEPTYASSTRLLIRGRDTRFLTSSGQDLTAQPGVIDSSLSKTLAETYAGIATSRKVAVNVVDDLHLGEPKAEKSGPVAAVAGGLAWLYRCGRAFVTAGFCADVDVHEKAILDVQEGTVAAQLGSTAGEAAGQPGSYVLEIASSGTTPQEAKAVTDAVADELVKASGERFREDAERSATNLDQQVQAADADVLQQSQAIAQFKTANGITAADEQLALSASAVQTMKDQVSQTQADLADTRAQLGSVDASLGAIPPTQQSDQQIETGRSSTNIETTGPNAVYSDLVTQRSTLQSRLNGLEARLADLNSQLATAQPLSLNGPQQQLAVLQTKFDLAKANQARLTADLQQARSNAVSSNVELSRIDEAAVPTYPTAPKRYLYLALGLLIGGLAGGGLTWLARRRRERDGGTDGTDRDGAEGYLESPLDLDDTAPYRQLDLRPGPSPEPAVAVPAHAGTPSRGTNGNGNGGATDGAPGHAGAP